jgi:hypothetical protein
MLGSHIIFVLFNYGIELVKYGSCLASSFVDPDPYVFGPLKSGSVIICTDLDPDPDLSFSRYFVTSF